MDSLWLKAWSECGSASFRVFQSPNSGEISLRKSGEDCEIIGLNLQLGYEPIPPRPGKTLFGSPTLILPNIFQYGKWRLLSADPVGQLGPLSCLNNDECSFAAGHIKKMDGFIGCYRGLAPKLVGSIVGSICSERIADKLGLAVVIDEDTKDDADLSDFER